jgi:hypothetical protein
MMGAPLSTIEYSIFRDVASTYQALGAFENITAELSAVSPTETLNCVKMTANMELTSGLFLARNNVVRMGVPPIRIEILTSLSGVEFEPC